MGLKLINDYNNVNPMVQKWSVINWFKSVWDLKSEISSLHFKVISP